jgi:hypothetical protein
MDKTELRKWLPLDEPEITNKDQAIAEVVRIRTGIKHARVQMLKKDNREIDKWARQARGKKISKLKDLCEHLARPYCRDGFKDDYKIARVFFVWVCDNVVYDFENAMIKKSKRLIGEQTAELVFKKRKAVCAGYCSLFKEMCTTMGVECRNICGTEKAFSYVPNTTFNRMEKGSGHMWNAIKIYGLWYLADVTWAAGQASKTSNTWRKNFENFWWCTSKPRFEYTHFAKEDKEDSYADPCPVELRPTMDGAAFAQQAYPTADFFTNGLEFLSHKKCRCSTTTSGKPLELRFSGPKNVRIIGKATLLGKKRVTTGDVFVQRDPGEVDGRVEIVVYVKFPVKGEYLVKLFVLVPSDPLDHKKMEETEYQLCSEYLADVIQDRGGARAGRDGFPKLYKSFMENDVQINDPSHRLLSSYLQYSPSKPDLNMVHFSIVVRDGAALDNLSFVINSSVIGDKLVFDENTRTFSGDLVLKSNMETVKLCFENKDGMHESVAMWKVRQQKRIK